MGECLESGLLSVEHFLEMEERSEIRHEYVGGVRHAVSGQGRRHNLLCGNLMIRLDSLTERGLCRSTRSPCSSTWETDATIPT